MKPFVSMGALISMLGGGSLHGGARRFAKGVWYDEHGGVERSVYDDLRYGHHTQRPMERRVPLAKAPHPGFDGFWEDDTVMAFVPNKPCAAEHLLIVPKDNSIRSVKALGPEHLDLLHHLREVAVEQLELRVARTDSPTHGNVRFEFSFHVPPFNSIDHLHLHAFALPFDSAFRRIKYYPGTPWCASYEQVVTRLMRSSRRR